MFRRWNSASHASRSGALLLLAGLFSLAAGGQTLSPASLSFGTAVKGQSSSVRSITLANTSAAPLTITGTSITGDFSQTNNCPATGSALAPQASCTYSVLFTPQGAGNRTGILSVATSASATPLKVALAGTGYVPLRISAASLWFGQVAIHVISPAKTVTLTNTLSPAGPITLNSIQAIGDFAQTNTCIPAGSTSAILTSGASCSISITFTPQAGGQRNGSIQITDSAPDSPQSIVTGGTGLGVSVALSPASATLQGGQTLQFTASGSNTNNGNVTWSVNGVTGGSSATGTITSAGLYTAPAVGGSYKVTATSQWNPALSASSQLTVGAATVVADFAARQNNAYPIPANLLGAGLGGTLQPTSLPLLTHAGLTTTRFHANIQTTYSGAAPDWTAVDSQLTAIQNAGMHVILEMDFTPTSLLPTVNPCASNVNPNYAAPADTQKFAQAAASYVTHIDGKFPGLVQDYEIWNEPDGGGLCAGSNSEADKLNAYMGIYAAVAPALRAAAQQDGTQIRIGGPTLGSPYADAPSWIPALLSNPATAPYVDFVSFHYYITSPTDVQNGLSWLGSGTGSTAAPSLLAKTQNPRSGLAALYEKVATLVRQGSQPNAATTPIYLDEYNSDWGFVNDCCRNDPTYAPLWNSLAIVDLLNSVYNGAQAVPSKLLYYAVSNHPFCLVGQIDALMDCKFPYGAPGTAQPYPQYYALQLFASNAFLGLSSGGTMAKSVTSADTNIVATALYTPNADTVVLVNTSGTDYAGVPVMVNNPGYTGAQATAYILNSSNPTIATEPAPLTAANGGFSAVVALPRYSVVALSLQPSSATGVKR